MLSAKALMREEHACIMQLLACLLFALHWYQIGQAEPCDRHTPLIVTYKTIITFSSPTIPPPNQLQLTTTVGT
uniref:Secreted protein n=1 Tax=Setaria viridis TaxID=4556 RepID=A0A4U6VNI5_SETVI|nr:hypothetical protein SEVIR_2G052450v2 [Setaria viridis]